MAQMIMLNDWHPDVIEFIISKMQNPRILRYLIENIEDETIQEEAKDKLSFTPLTNDEMQLYQGIVNYKHIEGHGGFTEKNIRDAEQKIRDGGTYSVNSPEFLSGANISVCITDEFMNAVENDDVYELRFPDVANYTEEEMAYYNDHWNDIGDVREWERLGFGTRVYKQIRAKELWNLINICATYSAEPGIFFIDNANKETNASAYGQKVVATNPCFHPSTRISTEFGLMTIEELYNQQGSQSFYTATDNRLKEEKKVVNGRQYEIPGVTMRQATVFPTGAKETKVITLQNGMTLNVTPEHRVYTDQGWKEAQHLTEEDTVYIQSGEGQFAKRDELSHSHALFLGWLTGDGWLANDGRAGLTFGKDDMDIIPQLIDAGEEISGLRAKVHERENGTFQMMYHRKTFTELLESLGVKRVRAYEKRVPEAIFTATKESVVTYLRALFSADGTVYTTDPSHRTARLTSSSKQLLEDVQLLLLNLGIHGKVYERPKRNQQNFNYVTVDGEERTYDSRPFFELVISGRNLSVFKEEVGFYYHTKKEELLDIVPAQPRKREYFTTSVKSIEQGELVTVYDITEPETHSLIANGVVVHNCGEQPLAPYSVCNLAAVNLASIADRELKQPDFAKLKQTVETGVRMQDNVIDSTPYFLDKNREQALGERRVGLGVMGLHDLLIYCETAYGSQEGNELVDQIFETIATTAYRTSIDLAKEKGSFPFLIGEAKEETQALRERFINTGYMQKMPDDIKQGVLDHGIRNSHLLTVAPTGSTGTMVGVSTGLEPYFSFTYYRSGRLGKFIEVKADIAQDYFKENPEANQDELPDWFVTAMDLSPEAHADTQCVIQRWVDSSISKTVNAPKGYRVDQVEQVYQRLYRGGAKGGTVYVDGSRDSQVLTLKAEENEPSEQTELFEDDQQKVVLMDTVHELETTNVTVGSEVGDTCPVCRQGDIQDVGGCNTCTNCGAQLKCGI
ncbi:LAGLIDADG family homing endonuclease [Alkalibacillus sp. S2W]|uniref:LAGLIDADG family homing endonuclease n=1 Tax=Alkalibacillus sp. S2W TaxID=3386553 RepID=UPI00398D2EC1